MTLLSLAEEAESPGCRGGVEVKNKLFVMVQANESRRNISSVSPSCGLSLTWNEGPLYEKANFLPYWSPAQNKLPLFSPPCLAPMPLSPPLPGPQCPLFPPSRQHMRKFTITDDINMPESSVRHTNTLDMTKTQTTKLLKCVFFKVIFNISKETHQNKKSAIFW